MQDGVQLLCEKLGLCLVSAVSAFDFVLQQLLEQPYLNVWMLGLGRDRVEELLGEDGDVRTLLIGESERLNNLAGGEPLAIDQVWFPAELAEPLLRAAASDGGWRCRQSDGVHQRRLFRELDERQQC